MSNYSKFAKQRRISRKECKRNALLFSAYYNTVRLMLNYWTDGNSSTQVLKAMAANSTRLVSNFNNERCARTTAQEIARYNLPVEVDYKLMMD